MNLTSWYELRDHKGRLVESGYALTFEQEAQRYINDLQAILNAIIKQPPKREEKNLFEWYEEQAYGQVKRRD